MAESSLQLTFSELCSKVGSFLGYGRGAAFADTAWDTRQTAAIEDAVASGLRNFYFPKPDGGGEVYDWSFLKPTGRVTLVSGASAVVMPDDFGGFIGDLAVEDATVQGPVPVTNEGRVRILYTASPTQTGRPVIAALRQTKEPGKTASQRTELYLFPLADADYDLSFCYYLLPSALSGSHPYAYGGAAHAETILESCFAVAEQRLDDTIGVHTQLFNERLAASIAIDRRTKPKALGYMGDRSNHRDQRWRHGCSPITYNGESLG